MVAFGLYTLGWRRTLIFFALGTILPLSAELLGTSTGWPFGGYAYTDGLGAKIAGRVPYTVPLSWFYMGFASYLLACVITGTRQGRRTSLAIVMGAWLLMAWDLVLDPAMASAAMPIHFWTWHESGPYFGMPIRNLVGWFGTGLTSMALSRWLWRADPDPAYLPTWLPWGMYAANVAWAMALSLSVGLWPAAAAALVLGLPPASLAWRLHGRMQCAPTARPARAMAEHVPVSKRAGAPGEARRGTGRTWTGR
jgi:putative membrane protein